MAAKSFEYIEVTLADIALANRLAHEVLGRSLDELPPQTRRVLGQLVSYVGERARTQGIERAAVRFTRREAREWLGASEKQARVHLDRLCDLEYVLAHAGRHGQRFSYELLFDGEANSDKPQAVGLIEVEKLSLPASTAANFVAPVHHFVATAGNLVGRSWPDRGTVVASSSGPEIPLPARPDADLLSLVAALPESAVL